MPAHHQCPLYSIVFVVQPLFVAPKRIQNSVADTSVLLLLPLSHLHNFICNTFWAFRHPLPLSDPRLMFSAGGKLLHAFINKNYARLLICSVIGVVVVLFPCWPLSTHEYSSLNIWGPINRCILAAGCCRQSQDQGATAAGSFIN